VGSACASCGSGPRDALRAAALRLSPNLKVPPGPTRLLRDPARLGVDRPDSESTRSQDGCPLAAADCAAHVTDSGSGGGGGGGGGGGDGSSAWGPAGAGALPVGRLTRRPGTQTRTCQPDQQPCRAPELEAKVDSEQSCPPGKRPEARAGTTPTLAAGRPSSRWASVARATVTASIRHCGSESAKAPDGGWGFFSRVVCRVTGAGCHRGTVPVTGIARASGLEPQGQ
jgi:hypothetical protein